VETNRFDVLIVGAGLSGIGAAYHLQKLRPNATYAILEGRERLGGTWDLFQYPGIRSDSDMYTLGYSFRPWTNPKAIADGPSILAYLRETAEMYGIDEKIRYRHMVERARWSSDKNEWTVDVRNGATGETEQFTTRFLFVCAGYYEYDSGYTPDLPGIDRFKGRVVHPQAWSPDIDYEGKRVVVIGSGATAVTLVPELAKRAAKVTMLQRSPTYIISRPERDRMADFLRERLPAGAAYAVSRWKNVLLSMGFFHFSRRFPERAKKLIIGEAKRALRGGSVEVSTKHFTPSYNPWDQRLCLVPDGDLFDSVRHGRASIVTDHIDTFTETGIRLKSGDELDADLVITATGLQLKFLGGLKLSVDGKDVVSEESRVYKGMMVSDVPNLAFAIGYTNASWTLKCDLTSEYFCRIMAFMERRGYTRFVPRWNDPALREEPLLDFTSGYVQRAKERLPRQGSFAPWKLYQNYVLDLVTLRYGRLDDPSMEFARSR
jgi:monooxygenase